LYTSFDERSITGSLLDQGGRERRRPRPAPTASSGARNGAGGDALDQPHPRRCSTIPGAGHPRLAPGHQGRAGTGATPSPPARKGQAAPVNQARQQNAPHTGV
jgi:hypothetical protein